MLKLIKSIIFFIIIIHLNIFEYRYFLYYTYNVKILFYIFACTGGNMKKYCKKIIIFSIIILFLINWAYYSTLTLNSFYKYDLLDSVSSLELVHFVNNEPKESRIVYEKNSINIFLKN